MQLVAKITAWDNQNFRGVAVIGDHFLLMFVSGKA